MPNSDGAAPQEQKPSSSLLQLLSCCCCGAVQVAEGGVADISLQDERLAAGVAGNDVQIDSEKGALTSEEVKEKLEEIIEKLKEQKSTPPKESDHGDIKQNDALINQTIENIQTILIHINDQRYILPIRNYQKAKYNFKTYFSNLITLLY
ncbi:hypothetical protein N8772_00965 [Rickettsiales bacterium]|nr:hypothetical protein [Rickettsiales bacterium]